jgi:hypothetical protein
MPPRRLSICVYTTRPGATSTRFAQMRSRNAAASSPVTSVFAKLDSSNSAACVRVPRCSAAMAVDQCWPAQPRGRRGSSSSRSFVANQFGRSHPDFSPNAAPSAWSRSYVGDVLSGRPAPRSSLG